MLVRATKVGFYRGIRRHPADSGHERAGEPFELVTIKGKKTDPKTGKLVDHVFKPEDQFSAEWMEKVVEKPAEAPAADDKKGSDKKGSKGSNAEVI